MPISNWDEQACFEKIKEANEAYRRGEPIMSDATYDDLIDELKQFNPDHEWFKHIEPVPVQNNRKCKLPIPMKSLNKVKNIVELKKWVTSLSLNIDAELVLMPKFDGLSLLHSEKTGQGWSRGGAENEGQDCTAHCQASFIKSNSNYLYTFGEFIITRHDWDKYFKDHTSSYTGEKYKSPRNTAAGFLNRDTPCPEIEHASFYRYGMDDYTLHQQYECFTDALHAICTDFTQPPLYTKCSTATLSEKTLLDLFKEWSKQYPIDGIVVYLNDLSLWEKIGRHQTTGNPLYAIAYKHPDFTDVFETTVKDVVWKVSKSGALKPVVIMDAVDTGDCIMESPTGYNAVWIKEHHIARGAKILVTRSGGVIPKILETLEAAPQKEQDKLWNGLTTCPHCNRPTTWNASNVELLCANPECSGTRLAKITHFFLTCGAENVGEETFSKMYDAGFTTIPSILNVTFDELMQIDGIGESISNTILDNNKKIMGGLEMATLMHASDCFEGIGKIKAQKIIDDFDEESRTEFYDSTLPPCENVFLFDSFSKTMQSFFSGLLKFYEFRKQTGIPVLQPSKDEIVADGVCAGGFICVSGFRDDSIERFIKQNGGTIVSGISKKTTLLIVKDKTASSSKIIKAQTFNVPILSIDEFAKKYGYK